MQLALNDDVLRGFQCGRVLKDNNAQINSLDFHRKEDLLITASNDDTLNIYDTAEGKRLFSVPSHKYGAQNVVWTHSPQRVIIASNKGDDHAVRLLEVASQGGNFRFIEYYRGHTARVTKVVMSPKNDTFITAAQDKEVRLWDIRTSQCQAVLAGCPSQPTVAIDQQGLVFAVGLANGVIKLYDASHYEQGPFDTFTVPDLINSPVPFSHLSFSNDGKSLLGVAEGKIFVLDAYVGSLKRSFSNGVTEAGAAPEASISYDGQYVLSGCEDKSLRVWSVDTGAVVATWPGHPGVPYCAKWAPKRLLAASACGALCLWIPSREVVAQQIQQQQQQQQQSQQQLQQQQQQQQQQQFLPQPYQ